MDASKTEPTEEKKDRGAVEGFCRKPDEVYKPDAGKKKVWDNSCSVCGTGHSSIPGKDPEEKPEKPEEKPEKPHCHCKCKCTCDEKHADPSDFCPDDNRTILTGEISPYMFCKLQEGKDHRPWLMPHRCELPDEVFYKTYWDRHSKDAGTCGTCGTCGTPSADGCKKPCREERREPTSCLPCRRPECEEAKASIFGCGAHAPLIDYMQHTPLYVEEEYLRGFAVLSYLKPPVRAVAELYDRYPEGGEWGWFAFVTDKGTFAYWDAKEKTWQLISNYAPEQLLALKNARFKDGDTFIWDISEGRFVVRQPAVYGIEMY